MYVGVEFDERATELRLLLLASESSLHSSCIMLCPVSFLMPEAIFLPLRSTISWRTPFCGLRSFLTADGFSRLTECRLTYRHNAASCVKEVCTYTPGGFCLQLPVSGEQVLQESLQ